MTKNDTGSSLEKMLALLDAFTHQRHAWTVEDLSTHFQLTPSSTYRYVKELCKAGLLIRLPRGVYVIGARVVELEALIRETDPVTQAGRPILDELVRETGCHALLSNVYGDHLLNVTHVPGIEPLSLTYLRGRSLPWFKGTPAKSIMAFWPKARVRKLFEAHCDGRVDEAQWEHTWEALRAIRKRGYSVSHGELDPGVVGYGAPVLVEEEVIGSISLVSSKERARFLNEEAIGDVLKKRSHQLGMALSGGVSASR